MIHDNKYLENKYIKSVIGAMGHTGQVSITQAKNGMDAKVLSATITSMKDYAEETNIKLIDKGREMLKILEQLQKTYRIPDEEIEKIDRAPFNIIVEIKNGIATTNSPMIKIINHDISKKEN